MRFILSGFTHILISFDTFLDNNEWFESWFWFTIFVITLGLLVGLEVVEINFIVELTVLKSNIKTALASGLGGGFGCPAPPCYTVIGYFY